jgi:NUDIX domain
LRTTPHPVRANGGNNGGQTRPGRVAQSRTRRGFPDRIEAAFASHGSQARTIHFATPFTIFAMTAVSGRGFSRAASWTTAEEAAARETLEEANLQVQNLSLLGVYTRRGPGVVVIVYEADAVSEASAGDETSEVRWFAGEAVPWDDLALDTTEWALKDWRATGLGDGRTPAIARPAEGEVAKQVSLSRPAV